MKSIFRGFYKAQKDDLREMWNSDKTVFIFDTNCLLNLYRCENQTRDDILNLMRLISSRIWIPFQVGYEYQRNRKEVIYNSLSSLEKVKQTLNETINSTTASINPLKKNLYTTLSAEVSKLKEEISLPIQQFIESNIEPRISQKKAIAKSDTIRTEIDEIIGDKCASAPTQEAIDKIDTSGEFRFENSLPPGFKDSKKTEESFFGSLKLKHKFGDLYLWNEIIEKAKDDKIENIIFICDDNKPDWWYIYNGETHGAHAHLLTEIYAETPLKNFKMVNQSTFLLEGGDFLKDAKVDKSSVEEMKIAYSLNTYNLSKVASPDEFEHLDVFSELELNRSNNNQIFQKKHTENFNPNNIPIGLKFLFLNNKINNFLSKLKYSLSIIESLEPETLKNLGLTDESPAEIKEVISKTEHSKRILEKSKNYYSAKEMTKEEVIELCNVIEGQLTTTKEILTRIETLLL